MDEFLRQKQAAEQQARDMDRRYREKSGMPPTPSFVQVGRRSPPARAGGSPFDLFKLLKLDGLSADKDRLLIIGLFLLLSGEGADEKLLYALLYILL